MLRRRSARMVILMISSLLYVMAAQVANANDCCKGRQIRTMHHNAPAAVSECPRPTDWFSYDPPTKSLIPTATQNPILQLPKTKSAETDVFSGLAEEIIVVGERQRRDFLDVKPDDELTGPQALDAAQPVVPWIGTACSYKTLCYDMKQPPLRAVLEKLFSN